MKTNTRFYLYMIMLSLLTTSVHSQAASEKDAAIESFLNAETAEARNLLSGFSFENLENYTNQYSSAKNLKEARKLWLVEEYYKRKADKAASERLVYVFLSVTLLMSLIFFLIFRVYQMQKNLEKME